MFSLLAEAWLPVRRADGKGYRIRPADLTSTLADNPVVAIDWPRPDFRLATLEFLIGLLATACPPRSDRAWLNLWHAPPSPEMLVDAFAPLADAFDLDGDGPRFMQDLEKLPGEPNAPETLLIEAPGEATRRNNTALLVKPGRIAQLSRAAAAMALFTLQTYAPSGGRGNLTSVRGGGPLTTLALPGAAVHAERVPLWHVLWANVPKGAPPAVEDLPKIFPWLAQTRTADRFPATTPADAHRLQAFWGMPRRIRLDFAPNPQGLACDLTGDIDSTIATGWRQRPNGVKYVAWDHPLSPSYKDAKSNGWLPVHPQPGGVGYRHWVALAIGDDAGNCRPAPCIATWRVRARDLPEPVRKATRLLASGYAMDNMKARAFVESEMPLPGSGDDAAQDKLAALARRLVEAAEQAAGALQDAIWKARCRKKTENENEDEDKNENEKAPALRLTIRDACYGKDASFDAAPIAAAYEAFWAATQDAFFAHLASPDAMLETVAPDWLRKLRVTAVELFDIVTPLDPDTSFVKVSNIVQARCSLLGTFRGYGSFGSKLFKALDLPAPERRKTKEPA